MSESRNRLLMIGLQGSGKSTFLGAFWHAVDMGRTYVGLRANVLPEQRAYLNRLRRLWEDREEIGRTSFATSEETSLELVDDASGRRMMLAFPDLSGEHYELQWSERRYRREYGDLARSAVGALLFVHPTHLCPPVGIAERNRLERMIEDVAVATERDDAGEDSGGSQKPLTFDPGASPTATQLVEVLQVLTDELGVPPEFPIGVIVSAWDLVEQYGISPEEYLEREGALLAQFLTSDERRFRPRFYGISAQGGDLKRDAARLDAIDEPMERIRVVGEDADTHDITAPVRWLMQTAL